MNGKVKQTCTPDEVQYYYHRAHLQEEKKAHCAIVFVHGLRDHAATHAFFFGQLNREGCHIPSFDLLGHGYSTGERCSIEDCKQHVSGSCASIDRIINKRVGLVIGLSPAFKVAHTASALVRFFAPLLSFLLRHVKNIPRMSFSPDRITDDDELLKVRPSPMSSRAGSMYKLHITSMSPASRPCTCYWASNCPFC